ncbi:MAG: metal ABC transporter permease [bacterium]
MPELLKLDLFRNPNTLWVLVGCVMLGVCSGILSSFAMLRRRSLLGDALAHAALPGVCIVFLITGTRSVLLFMLGAFIAGIIGAFCVQVVTKYSRLKEDAALGIVLSVFYAFGIVLLTFILHTGEGNKAGLEKFLFGQAAALMAADVKIMTLAAALITFLAIAFYKELKLLCFDPGFADGLGFSSTLLDAMLNLFIVLVVIIGLQAVGVILMVAMLITPAASARFWTGKLGVMVWLSALVGAFSGALGTYLSTVDLHDMFPAWFTEPATGLSTGPLIVLSATFFFVISLIFAPKRGAIARAWRLLQVRRKVARENILRAIYELGERRGNWRTEFSLEEIAQHRNVGVASIQRG